MSSKKLTVFFVSMDMVLIGIMLSITLFVGLEYLVFGHIAEMNKSLQIVVVLAFVLFVIELLASYFIGDRIISVGKRVIIILAYITFLIFFFVSSYVLLVIFPIFQ